MRSFYKVFIIFFLCTFSAFSFDENLDSGVAEKSPSAIKMEFGVYGGYNFSNFSRKAEFALLPQNNPYAGITSRLNYKNLEAFDINFQGFKYGFLGEVNIDSRDTDNPIYISEASFIISSDVSGNRIFGLQKPVTNKLKIDSTSFAGENEGINGAWQNLLKYPFFDNGGSPTGSFITKTFMPLSSGFTSSEVLNATANGASLQPFENWGESNIGISYVSKRAHGVRFGLSYLPDNRTSLLFKKKDLTDRRGFEAVLPAEEEYLKNIFAVGANYYRQFESTLEITLFAGYENAIPVSDSVERKDLHAVSGGFNMAFAGFMFGGSYTFLGKSLRVTDTQILGHNLYFDGNGNAQTPRTDYNFDIGLGYSIDKYTLHFAYFESMHSQNLFRAGIFTFETRLNASLLNYLQFVHYGFTLPNQQPIAQSDTKIKDSIILLGIKYKM